MKVNNKVNHPTTIAIIGHDSGSISSSRDNRKSAVCDTALAQFDSLPDAAHVRLPTVKGLFGCSSATIWRRVKSRQIPAPKKFGERISAWNVGELRKTLACAQVAA